MPISPPLCKSSDTSSFLLENLDCFNLLGVLVGNRHLTVIHLIFTDSNPIRICRLNVFSVSIDDACLIKRAKC